MNVLYNIVFTHSRYEMNKHCLLLGTILLASCGGGGGTSPSIGLQPLNPTPPAPTPQFKEEAVVLSNPNTYFTQSCMEPNVQFVLPTKLNSDEHVDFIVHYWCSADPWGASKREPTPDTLVAWASNGLGGYDVVNYEVFGDSYPEIGSATRKVSVKDINNDGLPDFAFATNMEDGRATGGPDNQEDALSNGAYPAILLSSADYKYTVHTLGEIDWGHAVDFAPNGDAVFAGYLWTAEQQAFRLQDSSFVDVSDQYPVVQGNSFRFGAELLVNTNRLESGNHSIELYNGLELLHVWERPTLFEVDIDNQMYPVADINGKKAVGGTVPEICVMDYNGKETFVMSVLSSQLISGEDLQEDYYYTNSEFLNALRIEFFQVEDNQLVRIADPIDVELDTADFNFMLCDDINGDGLDDLQIQKHSNRFDNDRDTGGIPDVLLQSSGGMNYVNTTEWPQYSSKNMSTWGMLLDVNADGYSDLMLWEEAVDLGDIEIYLGNKDL